MIRFVMKPNRMRMNGILIRNNAQHCACPVLFCICRKIEEEKRIPKRNHVENHFSRNVFYLNHKDYQSVTNLCTYRHL